jgi:hypothetical protein
MRVTVVLPVLGLLAMGLPSTMLGQCQENYFGMSSCKYTVTNCNDGQGCGKWKLYHYGAGCQLHCMEIWELVECCAECIPPME